MQHPLFRDLTRRRIGENVSVFRSMFMNKPASRGTELPWHQDVGKGWGIDSDPTTTVWTALDDATTASGCMQIVPGSHKLGILNEGHYASEEDQAAHCSPGKVIDLEVEAGRGGADPQLGVASLRNQQDRKAAARLPASPTWTRPREASTAAGASRSSSGKGPWPRSRLPDSPGRGVLPRRTTFPFAEASVSQAS